MNPALKQAAEQLVARAATQGFRGKTADSSELRDLNDECEGHIPAWYIDLLTTLPLCGLELGWQAYERDDDFDGILWMEWSDAQNMRSEMVNAYPGLAIAKLGYINAASDAGGGGDPYFFPSSHSYDPPLYQVFHDVSDEPEKILAKGLRMVAPSLSEFFRTALLRE